MTQLDLPCLRNVVRLLTSFKEIGQVRRQGEDRRQPRRLRHRPDQPAEGPGNDRPRNLLADSERLSRDGRSAQQRRAAGAAGAARRRSRSRSTSWPTRSSGKTDAARPARRLEDPQLARHLAGPQRNVDRSAVSRALLEPHAARSTRASHRRLRRGPCIDQPLATRYDRLRPAEPHPAVRSRRRLSRASGKLSFLASIFGLSLGRAVRAHVHLASITEITP